MKIQLKNDKFFEKGFTLVELLVVVGIITILAAIAIPQFTSYIQRSVRVTMISDAKNASKQLELYSMENQTYVVPIGAIGAGPTMGYLDGVSRYPVTVSKGNTVTFVGTATTYSITVTNGNAGAGKSPLTLTNTGSCTWTDGSSC